MLAVPGPTCGLALPLLRMPNGEDRNFVRLGILLGLYKHRFGVWPQTILTEAMFVESVEHALEPESIQQLHDNLQFDLTGDFPPVAIGPRGQAGFHDGHEWKDAGRPRWYDELRLRKDLDF